MDIEVALGMIILEEVEIGLGKDSIQVTLREMIEAAADQDQAQEGSTNRDRIRCFKHREYDHFAKDCLNISETEKSSQSRYSRCLT